MRTMLVSNGPLVETSRKYITLESKATKSYKFEFPSHDLAFQVRQLVYVKLIQFDKNEDEQFQEDQIRDFLVTVMNENPHEIQYFVKNVFRYDKNNDGKIQYDQLVNFCVEQHFGQIAIQRLHRKKLYQRGSQRVMSLKQFIETIKYALSFVEFAPQDSDIKMAFDVIDADKDGYISYEDYFRFLKEYFGSKSEAAKLVNKQSVVEEVKHSHGEERPLNIVKKYSKYDGKENVGTADKKEKGSDSTNGNSNLHISSQKGNNNSPENSNLKGSDILANSVVTQNNTNKKNTPQSSTKIQITLTNKTEKKEQKKAVVLSQNEWQIAERIVRLVWTQVKAVIIGYDSAQSLKLTAQNVFAFLRNSFNYKDFPDCQMFRRVQVQPNLIFSYEEATRLVINEQIYRTFKPLESSSGNTISSNQFGDLCQKVCGLMRSTPLWSKYQALYQLRVEKTGNMTVGDCEQLLLFMVNNYPRK